MKIRLLINEHIMQTKNENNILTEWAKKKNKRLDTNKFLDPSSIIVIFRCESNILASKSPIYWCSGWPEIVDYYRNTSYFSWLILSRLFHRKRPTSSILSQFPGTKYSVFTWKLERVSLFFQARFSLGRHKHIWVRTGQMRHLWRNLDVKMARN